MILQIGDSNLNEPMRKSLKALIQEAKQAHHTDACVRINGEDRLYQADWIKHLVIAEDG